MTKFGTGLVLAFLATAVMAQVAPSNQSAGKRRLQASLVASETLTYAGTRTVEIRHDGELRKNVEVITAAGGRTRTEFAPGSDWAGQIIIERGGKRYHYFPESNEIHALPPRRDEARTRLMRNLNDGQKVGLRLEMAPGGRVADRDTTLITLRDRRGNVVQRVWTDRETNLPLKRELVGPLGSVVGRFEFTRVNYHPRIDPADFEWNRKGVTLLTPRDLLMRAGKQAGMRPFRLPADTPFRLEAVRVLRVAGSSAIAQIYFGPGGRVTLFQVRGQINSARLRRLAGNGITAYTWVVDDTSLALIGDAEEPVLRQLAQRVFR